MFEFWAILFLTVSRTKCEWIFTLFLMSCVFFQLSIGSDC